MFCFHTGTSLFRWYALKNKPNSGKKEKYRGELEVRVLFTVKTVDAESKPGIYVTARTPHVKNPHRTEKTMGPVQEKCPNKSSDPKPVDPCFCQKLSV